VNQSKTSEQNLIPKPILRASSIPNTNSLNLYITKGTVSITEQYKKQQLKTKALIFN